MRLSIAMALGATMLFAGCGDDGSAAIRSSVSMETSSSDTADRFCEAMGHLIILLAPSGPTSPADTEATFTEAAAWFAQAKETAPPVLAADFAAYTAAYDEYAHFLGTVGFNLDRVFSTDEGRQLAIDTSHTLTPAIFEHVTGECGLSFGDETNDPPES